MPFAHNLVKNNSLKTQNSFTGSGIDFERSREMKSAKCILTGLLVLAAFVLQGCVVAAIGAGAGTVAYVMGDLEAFESADIDKVYDAGLAAAEDLELNVTQKSRDALSATIVARDAQDKKITIKLVSTAEGSTKISIRVGMFGSETKSQLIYNQIRKHL